MVHEMYREQLEEIERQAIHLKEQFAALPKDTGFKKKLKEMHPGDQSRLQADVARLKQSLSDIQLYMTILRTGELRTIESTDSSEKQRQTAINALEFQFKQATQVFTESSTLIQRNASQDFQTNAQKRVLQESLDRLVSRYQRRFAEIDAIPIPPDDFNFGFRDPEFKKKYDEMRRSATQAKAQNGVEKAHIEGLSATASLEDSIAVYQGALSAMDTAYGIFMKAEAAYQGLLLERQGELQAQLDEAAVKMRAFESKALKNKILWDVTEQEEHDKHIEGFENRYALFQVSISSADNRKALQQCGQDIQNFIQSIDKADKVLDQFLAKKVEAKKKELADKKANYWLEIQEHGREDEFQDSFQDAPDMSGLGVDEVLALLQVLGENLDKVIAHLREEVSKSEELRPPSLFEQFVNAINPPPEERDVLSERIQAYGVTSEQATNLLLTPGKRDALESLLDSAVYEGMILDEALNAYMPTLLHFMVADSDVLELLCKIDENKDEEFKEYLDKHHLLPRLLMLFHDKGGLYTQEICDLKTCLLSEKSDAYQMILASFLYDGHPSMRTDDTNYDTYQKVVLDSLRDQMQFKTDKTGLWTQLKDYPKDNLDELAHMMFAFSQAFHVRSLSDNISKKMQAKLRGAQFEVFQALVGSPSPEEGIKIAESIISQKFDLSNWQIICKCFLGSFEWGRKTEAYQYLSNKVQARLTLNLDEIKQRLGSDRGDKFIPPTHGGGETGA